MVFSIHHLIDQSSPFKTWPNTPLQQIQKSWKLVTVILHRVGFFSCFGEKNRKCTLFEDVSPIENVRFQLVYQKVNAFDRKCATVPSCLCHTCGHPSYPMQPWHGVWLDLPHRDEVNQSRPKIPSRANMQLFQVFVLIEPNELAKPLEIQWLR